MNTLDPSLQNNPSYQPRPDWFEIFLPVSALPLILVLLLIMPIFVLAAESLFAPVYEFFESLLMPVNAGMNYTSLPMLLIFKIIIFSMFAFTGVALLLLKISCLYHEVWSYFFPQPHPRHPAYHPDQQESMVSLFNWNIFRWYRILQPPVTWTLITVIAGAFWMWFSNSFTDFGMLTFQLQVSVGFFMMSVLGLFTVISYIKAIWRGFSTHLGDVIAITEPEKPTQVVFERAQKLSFGSPWVFLLYPLYGIFLIALIAEVIFLIVQYDIQDLLALNSNVALIFGMEVVTLVVYLVLSGMKFMAYHDALTRYYRHHIQ